MFASRAVATGTETEPETKTERETETGIETETETKREKAAIRHLQLPSPILYPHSDKSPPGPEGERKILKTNPPAIIIVTLLSPTLPSKALLSKKNGGGGEMRTGKISLPSPIRDPDSD